MQRSVLAKNTIMFYSLFGKVMPSYMKAAEYTEKFEKTMQITSVTHLQTLVASTHNKLNYLTTYYGVLNALVHLERVIGQRLETI